MKNVTKISISISVLLLLASSGWSLYSYNTLEKFIVNQEVLSENIKVQEAIKNYEVIECKFKLLNPEYAFVDLEHYVYPNRNVDNKSYNIYFSQYSRTNIFSNNWTESYIGGTTIKNTTFPQLVAMVKEDCSQFQGGFVNKDPDGIRWTHTRADTKEEKAESIRRVSYGKLKLFPEFIEVYGDIDEMTDDEVIVLHEQIKEEGLDAKVQMADDANDLRKELLEITQEQRDQVKQTYGEWKDFTNEEFLEWIGVIKVDMESGKFVLIGK